MNAPTYAGRTFILRIDNGTVFRNTYAADGASLHYETLEGPGQGAQETVDLHVAEAAAGLFFIGWVEKSGMTVTHLMNLTAATVHAFWTYENDGTRVGDLHTGTLEPA